LLANGATNRQIALQLVLAEGTAAAMKAKELGLI